MRGLKYTVLLLVLLCARYLQAEPLAFGINGQEIRARLTAQRYTTLSAELQAKIKRIHVREGEKFKAKQILVELDCTLQKTQLDKASVQMRMTRKNFASHQHLSTLNAIGDVELMNSKADMLKAKADKAYYQALLNKCTIYAPYDGFAGEQKVRELQFVQQGEPLLDIFNITKLELEFIVPTRWLSWLKSGHRFDINIESTGKNYPAQVMRTALHADPVSQSVKVIALIDGYFQELIPGMNAQVNIKPEEHSGQSKTVAHGLTAE